MKVTPLFSCCNTIYKNAISDSVIKGEKYMCVAFLLMVRKHVHNGLAVLLNLELAHLCLRNMVYAAGEQVWLQDGGEGME